MQTFERLAAWREEQKLSQIEAGAKVGVSGPAWNDWEKGKRVPQGGFRAALEIVTGIPADVWMNDRERAAIATATSHTSNDFTVPDDERPTLTPTDDARAA